MKSTKKEKSVLNKPGKALVGYLGAGAVSKIIGILATPIFTRLLGSEEYGKLACAPFLLSKTNLRRPFYKGRPNAYFLKYE